ncbi:MAG TPA: aspartate kinase [Bacteroidota bacterium]|nr:aspartate kinase [Bacteroidota bacterium]
MIIMKFGGTSNRDAAAMSNVLRIIKHHLSERPVVVISAIASATNELEEAARTAAAGEEPGARAVIEGLCARHASISSSLVHDRARADSIATAFDAYRSELLRLVHGVSILRELTPRTIDAFCSYGERFSSRLVAAGLQEEGVDAVWVDAAEFMVTDGNFGRAIPVMEAVCSNLARVVIPLLEHSQVPVTQGFIGVTSSGAYTTMGRESSDYSASIIGAALDADRVQIWTDVDGLLTADPRKVGGARKVRRMSFEEAFELSYFGAKVLHPRTMLPLLEKNIPVEIRNSRREDGTGTLILRGDALPGEGPGVKSISFSEDVTVVCVSPLRRTSQYHFWEGVFGVLSGSGIDVRSVATSEYRIAFTVTGACDLDGVTLRLREFGDLLVIPDQASLCIVGKGLRECPELAGRVFRALAGVKATLIAYGASGYSLTVVVDRSHLDRSLGSLHEEFFGSGAPDGEFDVPLN